MEEGEWEVDLILGEGTGSSSSSLAAAAAAVVVVVVVVEEEAAVTAAVAAEVVAAESEVRLSSAGVNANASVLVLSAVG